MAQDKNSTMKRSSPTAKRGVIMLTVIALVAFGACVLRIAYLTLVKGNEYREKAEAQQLMVTTLSADRGTIYDVNMNVLAQSASVWLVYINPSKVTDDNRGAVLSVLSECLDLDRAKLADKISANAKNGYLKIKGEVEYNAKKTLTERVSEEKITDVVFVDPDTKRYYPNASLASTILGFTGDDGNGLYGLEYKYDSLLTGTNGRVVTAKDGVQFELENAFEVTYDAKQGVSLILTIDSEIQTILEDALKNALEENNAKNVYGVVMNPKTGALLAVANLPDYDLNDPYGILYPQLEAYFKDNGTEEQKKDPVAAARIEQWKNKSVADYYYPGSVYKVFLVAGALEEGVIDENTEFYCHGTITIGDRTIKDFTPTGHAFETPETLLVNSCNTFAVSVGQQMGAELYFKYFQSFGFAEKTGVDLAGENAPRVGVTYHDPAVSFTWSDLASASFGQSISVTPLQVVTAISALANGGKLMQPYVVAKQMDVQGNVISVTEPVVKRQVISEKTARTVAGWMEKVVNDGTGQNAYVAGYHVAGKTGTSEKLGVSDTAYIASFAGFAPANDPEIAIVIVIDEPKGEGYSGGAIAAPVGGEVIERTLQYLGKEPVYDGDDPVMMTIDAPELVGKKLTDAEALLQDYDYSVRIVGDGDTVVAQTPDAGRKTPVRGVLVLYTEDDAQRETVAVPNFAGLTVGQANRVAVENGLNLRISGSNVNTPEVQAYRQDLEAGAEVENGSVITVSFRTTTGMYD